MDFVLPTQPPTALLNSMEKAGSRDDLLASEEQDRRRERAKKKKRKEGRKDPAPPTENRPRQASIADATNAQVNDKGSRSPDTSHTGERDDQGDSDAFRGSFDANKTLTPSDLDISAIAADAVSNTASPPSNMPSLKEFEGSQDSKPANEPIDQANPSPRTSSPANSKSANPPNSQRSSGIPRSAPRSMDRSASPSAHSVVDSIDSELSGDELAASETSSISEAEPSNDEAHNSIIDDALESTFFTLKVEPIRVVVRVRPLNENESQRNEKAVVTAHDDGQTVAVVESDNDEKPRSYTFHAVMGPSCGQVDFFQNCGIKALIQSAMNGYACTAFAYGQTGGGKTHTISGDDKDEVGIVQMGMHYLWEEAKRREGVSFTFKASYLEIYNEQVFDLLNPHRGAHGVRFAPEKGFYVENLYTVECSDVSVMLGVLEEGLKNRKTASHMMNERSSRSHTILSIDIVSIQKEVDILAPQAPIETPSHEAGTTDSPSPPPLTEDVVTRYGRMSFVDLAGSERINKTKSEGQTRVESQSINKSLLTLGTCISTLADPRHKGKKHIPYRNSLLTMLLKESIGGSGLTLMISCISPSKGSLQETQNTLRYASRAKRIQNKPLIFMDPKQQEMLALKKEVKMLRSECSHLRTQLQTATGAPIVASLLPEDYRKKMLEEFSEEDGVASMAQELTQAKLLLQQLMQENDLLRHERDAVVFGSMHHGSMSLHDDRLGNSTVHSEGNGYAQHLHPSSASSTSLSRSANSSSSSTGYASRSSTNGKGKSRRRGQGKGSGYGSNSTSSPKQAGTPLSRRGHNSYVSRYSKSGAINGNLERRTTYSSSSSLSSSSVSTPFSSAHRLETHALDSQYMSMVARSSGTSDSRSHSRSQQSRYGTPDALAAPQQPLGPSLRTGRIPSSKLELDRERSELDEIDAQIALAKQDLTQ